MNNNMVYAIKTFQNSFYCLFYLYFFLLSSCPLLMYSRISNIHTCLCVYVCLCLHNIIPLLIRIADRTESTRAPTTARFNSHRSSTRGCYLSRNGESSREFKLRQCIELYVFSPQRCNTLTLPYYIIYVHIKYPNTNT